MGRARGRKNGGGVSNDPVRKVGRNDPCHCGSGKKLRKCHGERPSPLLTALKAEGIAEQDRALYESVLGEIRLRTDAEGRCRP